MEHINPCLEVKSYRNKENSFIILYPNERFLA